MCLANPSVKATGCSTPPCHCPNPQTITLSYGSGQDDTGPVSTETISAGGVSLQNFNFLLVLNTGTAPPVGGKNGTMGFGYNYAAYGKQAGKGQNVMGFVNQLYATNQITNNLFAVYSNKSTNTFYFHVGDYDRTGGTYTGTLNWFPVASSTSNNWTVNLDNINGIKATTGQFLTVDTGTNSLPLPASFQTTAFYASFGNCSFGTAVTCVCANGLGDIKPLVVSLAKNGATYPYTLQPSQFATLKNGTCTLNFKFTTGDAMLSGPWIQYFYVVFDYTGNQVGIASY